MMRKLNWSKLIYSFLICQAAGILGIVFTISAIPTWYSGVIKPSFSPPNWIFGPVWTLLYALMAVSLYLIWTSHSLFKKKAIKVFAIQLLLNAAWTPIFFGLHSPLLGLIVIILMWIFIVLTIINFYQVSKTAALLLIPYITWVSFAILLNYFIWQLN